MKRRTTIALLTTLVLLAGCGREASSVGESLESTSTEQDFLDELATKGTEETEASPVLFPELVGGGAQVGYDVIDNEYTSLAMKSMIYTGEDVSANIYLTYEVSDDKIEDVTAIFFLLNEGVPQPFYFEDAEEASIYASKTYSKEELLEDHFFQVHFQPSYVPYGEETCMSLCVLIDNNYYFTERNIDLDCYCAGIPFYLTADSEAHAVAWEEKIPEWGGLADCEWNWETDSSTYGTAVMEKLTDVGQLKINTAFTTKEALYAYFSTAKDTQKDTEYEFLAFADGKPADLFNGSWYCSLKVDPERLYELPLDTESLSVGEHRIYILDLQPWKGHATEESDTVKLSGLVGNAQVYCVRIEE